MKNKLVTHINVDVDAVVGTCIEAILNDIPINEETIRFVSADTKKVEANEIAIDIAARKHNGKLSFVGGYYGNADILPHRIIEEVDEQDSLGYSRSRITLAMWVHSLRIMEHSDLEIVQHFKPFVEGQMKLHQMEKEAQKIFDSCDKVTIAGYKFLVRIGEEENYFVGRIAARSGLDGTIYWSSTGAGITRYSTEDENPLNLLDLSLTGWFAHPAGFLFCRGSRKAPKDMPPPQFKEVSEFVFWLNTHIRPKGSVCKCPVDKCNGYLFPWEAIEVVKCPKCGYEYPW